MAGAPSAARWIPPIVGGIVVVASWTAVLTLPTLAVALASPVATSGLVAASVGLVAVAALTAAQRRRLLLPTLLSAAAVSAVAPLWVGLQFGPGSLRALGVFVAPLLVPVLLALALLDPAERLRSRTAAIAASVVSVVLSGAVVAVHDPFRDLSCWADCTAHRPLVDWPAGAGIAAAALALWLGLSALAAVAAAVHAVTRAGSTGRRGILFAWGVSVPAASASIAAALGLVDAYAAPDARAITVATAAAALLLTLAIGAGVVVADLARRRRAAARLAALLGELPRPGAVADALAPVVGSSVRVAYPLTDGATTVGEDGMPIVAIGSRITLRRGQDDVALLLLDAREIDLEDSFTEVTSRIGPAARVALDNGRLQAEATARTRELVDSRRRIVAATDDTRRRIERDLHDGSQAQLVALLLLVGLARAEAESAGATVDAELLAGLAARAEATLAGLRELSHGLFPAVVEQLGLEAALRTLVGDRATLSYTAERIPDAAAARLAHLIAATALGDASDGVPALSVSDADGGLTVTVQREVTVQRDAPVPLELEDRVGAVGGSIRAEAGTWEAVIPCGS